MQPQQQSLYFLSAGARPAQTPLGEGGKLVLRKVQTPETIE